MNNFITNIQKKTSHKAILITALFALIFIALSCISYFTVYGFTDLGWELDFMVPRFLQLLQFLSNIIPPVFLVGYLMICRKNFKATVFFSVVTGIFAFYHIFCVVYDLMYNLNYYLAFGLEFLGIEITEFLGYYMYHIITAVLMILFIVSTRSAIKSNTNKPMIATTMLIAIVVEILYFLCLTSRFERYLDEELYLFVFTTLMSISGNIIFYISLMLFGLKCTIPKKIQPQPINVSPEYALKLLNEKLNCGLITEEEYRVQRAEIISKL